ncbi:MAG: ComEC/Rec2 family competence protein, partial [Pseudomonadota bacterium]
LPWALRAFGLPLLLPALLWPAQRPAPGSFELLAADIGQGTAVLVRTAGHTLLYDAGPRFSAESDAGERVLVPLLRALGERVDTVLLSHRDSDHIGGARAVLAAQPQAALLSSIEDGHALQALRRVTRCAAGQRWSWDGVQFELLHPLAQDYAQPRKSNAMSCVLRVQDAQGRRALLVGDIEAAQEAELIARATASGMSPADGASLRSEVLLLPHHGSQTSSSAAFLDAVAPRWALIQAGYLNRYGHPAPAVLARLRERGVAVVDTVRCGAARWSSAEAGAPRCERAHAPHYWQHQVPPRDVPGAGAQLAYPPAGESYAEIR